MSETSLAESAQVIFCSIADNLGVNKSPMVLDIKKYPTFSDFETNNKQLILVSRSVLTKLLGKR